MLCLRKSFAATLVLAMLLPHVALAAASDAEIVVNVNDAQTGAPLPLVQVILHGPVALNGLTGDSGQVTFENVPVGAYSGNAQGLKYQPTPIRQIDVRQNETTTISITLSKLLKIIGAVTVARAPKWTPDAANADDPRSIGSQTPVDSLGTLPGATLSDNGSGSSFLSIDGHSSTQTVVSADGVPIAPPSMGVNLRSIGSDLFDGVTVHSGSTGAVDFHVPDPTLAQTFYGQSAYSTRDSSSVSVFSRGTSGRIGYSVGYSAQGINSGLNGDAFLDRSGLTYVHDAATLNRAAVVKLRIPVSAQQVLTLVGLSSQFEADDQCNIFTGVLPCGNGPGNASHQHLNSWQAKYAATSGYVSLAMTAFGSAVGGDVDDSRRVVNSLPEPISAKYNARTQGLNGSISLYSGAATQFSSSFVFYSTHASGSGVISGITSPSSQPSQRFGRVGLSGVTPLSKFVKSNVEAGLNGATGSVLTPYINASLSISASRRQTITAAYGAGILTPASNTTQGFALPSFLSFDCKTKTVFGTAPATTTAPAESSETSVLYDYKAPKYTVDVSAYRQVMHGAVLNGIIGGQFVAPSVYPPNYLSDIASFFASNAGCGYTAAIAADNLSLSMAQQDTAVFEGVHVAGHFNLNARTILDLYYNTTVAHAIDTLPGSTFAPNQQLVGVPLQTLGIALDVKPGNGKAEVLGTLQHISANNANYLPAYNLVGLAARVPLQRGMFVASVSNLFNQYAPMFGSTSDAVPIPRIATSAIRPIAMPLSPRTFQLRYQLQVGGSPQAAPDSGSSDFGLPTSATLETQPLTAAAANPYAIAIDNPQCGPEQVGLIRPFLDSLKQYVEQGQYASTKSMPLGETLYLRQGPRGSAAFLVSGSRPAVETALFSCVVMHSGSVAQAQAVGLFAPTDTDKDFDLLFSPTGGFYITLDRAHEVRRDVSLLVFTGKRDPQPFALRTGAASCTSDMKDAAAYLLTDLRSHLSLGASGYIKSGMTIVGLASARASFEIRFEDPSYRISLLSCGRVYSVTSAVAAKLGIAPSNANTLNYSPEVGFYVVLP